MGRPASMTAMDCRSRLKFTDDELRLLDAAVEDLEVKVKAAPTKTPMDYVQGERIRRIKMKVKRALGKTRP